MQAWTYPATLERLDGEVVVRFADVPEAITGAATEAEARDLATDALAAAIEEYLSEGRAVPAPRSEGHGEVAIPLDPALAARVLLVQSMTAKKVSKVALAAMMNRDEKVIRRIIAGQSASLDLTLAALRVMGVRAALAA